MSLLGFSGSGQFAALPLAESDTSLLTIVFVTALINSRYFALALSCSEYLPRSTLPRVLVAHMLGDEAYAIERGRGVREVIFVRLSIFCCWVASGVLGGITANAFPSVIADNANLEFPASAVLLFLAISQLKAEPFESGLVTMPKAAMGVVISGACLHALGGIYFWIPSILLVSALYFFSRGERGRK